jgi:hypothetical protein
MDNNPFDGAAAQAAAETDDALAGEQAKIGLPAQSALKKMLPTLQDQQTLDDLIQTVNAATDHNEQVAALINNISSFAGVIVKLLRSAR